MDQLANIHERLDPLRMKLLKHPLYARLDGVDALRIFMEHHIYAVWDFMSLLKTLQRRLSVIDVPWVASPHSLGCRLVNEIVLGEESDDDGRGGYASHFELYHRAMTTFGAETAFMDDFLERLQSGETFANALATGNVPTAAQRFVIQTFDVIQSGDLCGIASTFLFGREDLLPDLFQQIVNRLNAHSGGKLDEFEYYLHRHIELDRDEHGPMAQNLITAICGTDAAKWQVAEAAAVSALQARVALWDGVLEALDAWGGQKRTA